MLRRHNPFYIAAVAGLAALALALVFYPHLAYVLAANTFFIVYLILAIDSVSMTIPVVF